MCTDLARKIKDLDAFSSNSIRATKDLILLVELPGVLHYLAKKIGLSLQVDSSNKQRALHWGIRIV